MPDKNYRFELLKKKEAMLQRKKSPPQHEIGESSDNFHKSFVIKNSHAKSVEQFVKESTSQIYKRLEIGKKVNFRLSVTMARFVEDDREEHNFHFSKPNYILSERRDFKIAVLSLIEYFNMKISEAELKGTGWQLESIDGLSFYLYDIIEETGGCYQILPDKLYNRKVFAILKSKNNECFKDCINYLSPDNHNFSGLNFPAGRRDIAKFEKNNPKYLIYVYFYDTSYGIFYKHKNYHEESKTKKVLNLFFYKNHFYPIKNEQYFQRMIFKVKKRDVFVCKDCLSKFNCQDDLNHHHTYCQKEYKMKLNYPPKGKFKQFNEFYALHKMPFFCILDIESCLKKVNIVKGNTTLEQEHVGTHFGLLFINRLEQKYEYNILRSVEELKKKLNEYKQYLEINLPLVGEERKKATIAFLQETHCYACGNELQEEVEKDHCHFTGKFRGIACKSCNMKMQGPNFLPVFAHNMMGYDGKLIIKELNEELKILAKNSENFIMMETKCTKMDPYKIRFLDSYNFLQDSLEKLVKDLARDEFKITRHFFQKDAELFMKKGYFPYDFYDDLEKLNEKQLPSQDKFYNKMTGESLSNENYAHCKQVWETRNHQIFDDYLKDYLMSDCTLLADVFLFFLERMYGEYGLDASYFFTLPHFGYTCLLKFTKQKLELLSDPTMYNMVERGIRGGFCTLVKRKALANNPYMDNFNPEEETSYLWDLDANNLYGKAMCEELPVGNFKWGSLDWENNGKCFVDVDVYIPSELKPTFEQYPLCPERKDGKLIADFYEKKGFVCHSDYLRSILKKGYKIRNVNSCITFDSKAWIKPFILKNTELRKQSKSTTESNFFKLLNNSVYGKQIEDVRNRVDVKVVKADKLKREIKKPNFKNITPLVKNELYLVELDYTSLKLDKPIYGGLSILDYSKIHMHEFLYDYIYPKFEDNVEVVYSDTDSFVLQIYCDDVYEKILPDIEEYFDTSNFPDDFKTLSGNPIPKMNKKVLGKFKDEKAGKPITGFWGLRPKMYIMEPDGEKRIKGVSKLAQKKITSKDFNDIIEGRNNQVYGTMRGFRSRNHTIFTENQHKLILDGKDTKRQILEDNIHTLPWGY